MKLRKIIGWVILALLAISLFTFLIIAHGLVDVLIASGILIAIIALATFAAWLIY
jgi:hypothetical protein